MLAGDTQTVSTLRGLKSSILYAKIAAGLQREEAMPDDALLTLLQKESKKRQESADLYRQGGGEERAAAELAEKAIIERYLPTPLSELEISALIDEVLSTFTNTEHPSLGEVIGKVKQHAGASADGALIARVVREKLSA